MDKLWLGIETAIIGMFVVFFILVILALLIVLMNKLLGHKDNVAPEKTVQYANSETGGHIMASGSQASVLDNSEDDPGEILAVCTAAILAYGGERSSFNIKAIRPLGEGSAWRAEGRRDLMR